MDIHISPALQRRLDGYPTNDRLVEAGRKLACEGIVVVPGFPDARISLLDNWDADPFGSRSWQWTVAAFRFIPGLIAYHARSGDQTALAFAVAALKSWEKAIKGPLKKYEFAKHDHATANQAENLVHLLAYLRSRNLMADAWSAVAATIHRHADLLSTEEFYSRHTNHGIEQARILAVVADFFPTEPKSAARLSLAVERLTSELEFAFTKEGVHVENSPGYHVYVCLSFIKILDYFSRSKLGGLAEGLDTLMPKAIRFLAHVIRPDGTLPLIGDTVGEKPTNYFKRYVEAPAFKHLQYAISQGEKGVPSRETTAHFPQAGYFIARDEWGSPGEVDKGFHLIFRSGYRSDYHRHDDDLNIVLYYGEDWLIDSGAYNYSERDPIRRYMRSKWAHNVPVIREPVRRRWDWKAPPMSLPMFALPTSPEGTGVRAVTHSYPGHVVTRDLRVAAGKQTFSVVDTVVQVESVERRRYLSLWHVPADKDVRIEDQSVFIASQRTGRTLIIENVGRKANNISLIDAGLDGVEGAVMSCVSNKLEPVQLLAFEWAGHHLHSVLSFRFE